MNLKLFCQPSFNKATMEVSKLYLKSEILVIINFSYMFSLAQLQLQLEPYFNSFFNWFIFHFICSSTFGVMEISVMTTRLSSGTAAKPLFQRPCGRQDAFAENTKTKKNHKKTKHQYALVFFCWTFASLFFVFLFFIYSVHIVSSAQGLCFLSFFYLFYFLKWVGYR